MIHFVLKSQCAAFFAVAKPCEKKSGGRNPTSKTWLDGEEIDGARIWPNSRILESVQKVALKGKKMIASCVCV